MSVIERQEKYNYLNKENRVIYDRRRLEAISISEVIEEHPEWIKSRQETVGKSEERIQKLIHRRMVADLAERMLENNRGGCGDRDFCVKSAQWIMENVQQELLPNINEWIENRPISTIPVHGVTVSDIMTQFQPDRSISFIEAVECMICWKQINYKNKRFCRLFFVK